VFSQPNLPQPNRPSAAQPTTITRGGRTRGRVVVRRTVAVVVVLLLIAVGYVAFNYQTLVSGITHVNALVPGASTNNKDENILLVGDDHRPTGASAAELAELGTTQDGGSDQTDTIMLLHIPANGKNPTLISFPRDSWVNVPGVGMRKLNAAFEIGASTGGNAGGAQMLVRVIQNMTGLTVNHFVRISLLGFYNVVNALGPVTVCLKEPVNDPYSGIDLPAGYSKLTAKQALAFVRQRHGLAAGDLTREARQQYFLSIEAKNILTAGTLLDPVKLHNVITAVSSSIQTDPGLNLLSLAAQVKGFDGHIASATIPVQGTPTIEVGGTPVSIVEVNTAATRAFIAGIIGTESAPTPTATATPKPQPSTISLDVVNGGHVNGAASLATSTLAKAGFVTGTPSNTVAQAITTVNYPTGDAAQAAVVAGYLPGSTTKLVAGSNRIQVVLGTDGVVAKATAGASSTSGSAPATTPGATTSTATTTTYTPQSCVS
jgi:LCP family protein required for cell wall assembly